MQKHIPWPSIEQFRNVVKNVQHQAAYVGKDEAGEPVYNKMAKNPTLDFEGTIKLHGTNSSCYLTPGNELVVQSRQKIITPERDNAGFAMFVEKNKDSFMDLLITARRIGGFHTKNIAVFGEWCGQGIQKGVGVSELPKMFVIFGIAVILDSDKIKKVYFTRQDILDVCEGREYVKKPEGKIPNGSYIYCIYDFPTYNFIIDFENPHFAQNELNKVCLEVETECPFTKAFGVQGIGEGIVIRCVNPEYDDSGYWAKIKGSMHSKSKVKTLATIDVERLNSIQELADRLAHNGRLEQMHQTVFDTLNGGDTDITKLSDFIKAVMADVFKEDLDIVAASGFTGKAISGPIAKICRNFIMSKLGEFK